MIKRVILTHTIHAKMFRKPISAVTVIQTNIEEIKFWIEEGFGFINAFGNLEKLPIVEKALHRNIEYAPESVILEFGDMLLVPVIEEGHILYWDKIVVFNPLKERPCI